MYVLCIQFTPNKKKVAIKKYAYLAVRPAAVMVEVPVAPPTVPVAPEFCWGSIINESKLIIPDIFDAEFGPGLFA